MYQELCSAVNTMGAWFSTQKPRFVVYVKTGDRKYAGTDANVKLRLHDADGNATEDLVLNHMFRNDFERGHEDEFYIADPKVKGFRNEINKIEFWRDNAGFGGAWFVDRITVECTETGNTFVFPVFRWVRPNFHYMVSHLDTSLPQFDPHSDQRKLELQEKKALYQLTQKVPGIAAQVKAMPDDEAFSWDYKWDILKRKAQLIVTSKIVKLTSGNWASLVDLKNVYTKEVFCEPTGTERWCDDMFFAFQKIASMNHSCIELCTKVPDKLGVTEDELKPLLEGLTIQQAIDAKRLFMIDHTITENLPSKEGFHTCAPIALFFSTEKKQLMPVAIQLYQQKSETNPVFYPTDPPNLWLAAKMWFNNADCDVHQALTHLCFTHLLMEGVTVVTHRNLSGSHPVFKLLAPHFLFLIAINSRALEFLVAPNGWIDKTMNMGIVGLFELNRRGISRWRMDVEGTLPEDLNRRGLLDPDVLPGYHFRDDAILVYNAIHTYVKKYVDLYYDTDVKIMGDWELQDWGVELAKDKEKGGCGLLGVPGQGRFSKKEDLYLVLTSVIYTCSVAHAASNFPQYDEYAFPPNYPAYMAGEPPKSKDELPESVLLKALPDKPTTLDIMIVTNILSQKGTNSLGNFEVEYIFDPKAKAFVEEFRAELAEVSKTIKERNKTRNPTYPFLDPDNIPNSISI